MLFRGLALSVGLTRAMRYVAFLYPLLLFLQLTIAQCRTHVVYQSYVEDPGVDKHRWWAGIFLDQPLSFAVYPPKNADQAASWHLPLDLLKPQHDQGRIHIPLHIDAIADPEPLHRILDMNLGRGYITPKGRTTLPYDGNHLMMMINNQARKRKEMVCPSCFDEIRKMEPKPELCSCTFRKRYLDRWICFPCFMKEEIELEASLVKQYEVEEVGPMHYHLKSWKCRCGVAMMVGDEPSAICNWCRGPIVGDEAANEDEATGDNKNEDSQLNEDENAGPEPENLPADIMGMVKNKDGSMSVWLNGERIHGESLSREMVVKFAIAHGEDVGCSCCHCHHRVQGYQHVHDHEEEQEEAGDSDSDDTMSEEDDDMADDDDDDNDDDEMADEDEEEYGDMPSLEQMGVMFDLDEMEADVD
jgi:hypothetical protein